MIQRASFFSSFRLLLRSLIHPKHIAHDAVGNEDSLFGQFQRFFGYFQGALLKMRLSHPQAVTVQLFSELFFQLSERHSPAGADGGDDKVVVAGIKVKLFDFRNRTPFRNTFDIIVQRCDIPLTACSVIGMCGRSASQVLFPGPIA